MSYNHMEPQSLNNHDYNQNIWRNIKPNSEKGHSYTWRKIYSGVKCKAH